MTEQSPKAYLNYIMLDKNFNYLNSGFERLTESAADDGTGNVGHQKLSFEEIAIAEDGYLMVFLSNESQQQVEVFWDDFRVEHHYNAVLQADDYYPFGLSFNSYQRSYSKANDFKYQGKEEVPEMGVGTYNFHARMYDATLGRTFQIDPLADNFLDVSPYSWVMNNPLNNIDPTGMSSVTLKGDDARDYLRGLQNIYGDGSGSSDNSESSSGGCGENGEPCPDGQEQGDNLMPEGALSYKEVVPNGNRDGGSNEGGSASGALSWIGVGAGIVGEGADLIKYSQTVTVPVYDKTGKAIAGWNVISKQTGQVLKYVKAGSSFVGYATAGIGVAFDAADYANGDISGARFSYHTIGTGVATGVGIIATSGLGALVGASFIGAEYAYDLWMQNVQPVINQGYSDLNNALNNGWRPR